MNSLFKKSRFLIPFLFVFLSLCIAKVHTSYAQMQKLPADTALVSNDQVTIKGQDVPYQVEVGTMPVYGEDGEPDASLFYTYYKRSDVENDERRPIIFSFNGGPGSASAWMHLGYTSPVHLNISSEGYPVQPYGVEDNNHSILDVADIIYVNPVNTGFSRILNDGKGEQFFGVMADITYLADWISNFISRKDRWESPKYLIGESYGTTRVAGLAGELQSEQWMHLNGVILVSGSGGTGDNRDIPSAVSDLPYFTATAWYHEQLPTDLQEKDIDQILPEVEEYAIEEYLPAITQGGYISETREQEVAKQVAQYTGLDEEFLLDYNLTVPTSAFWKELLRDDGYTVGRLDSRYKGIDKTAGGDSPDYAAELRSWEHSFTPAINNYIQEELGFKTDLKYNLFGPVRPWDRGGRDANTGEMLRQAMAENPYLKVFYQSGYYDGATDYFSSKYGMWNLDPTGKMREQDRLSWKGYRSGHMMYLRDEDRKTANEDIREFINDSIPPNDEPARY